VVSRRVKSTIAAFGLALALGAGSVHLVACASLANVDVSLADAGRADAAQGPLGDRDGGSHDAAIVLPPAGNSDAGCDCDTTAGLGCCLPAGGGAAFCAAANECTTGIYAACEKYEPVTESYCCWNDGTGAGSSTRYAGECGARPVACTRDDECTGGAKCETSICGALTIGTCGGPKPSCP
jgi:hypothetical protein